MGRHGGTSIVLTALLLLGAAACGGDSDAALPNACELLTTDEADGLLGVPTNGASEDTDRSGGTYCEWVSQDSDDGGDASDAGSDSEVEPYFLSVEIDQGTRAVQNFEAGKSYDSDERDTAVEAVADLGDDAYSSDAGGLEVRKGDRVFSTYTDGNDQHPLDDDERRDIERRAADIVLGRIGNSDGGTDIEAASECGRTGRCSGTRYRACDLVEDAEIQEVTGFVVSDVNGAIVPGGSENGGVCAYVLDNPNLPENSLREIRRVEVRVEPDREPAEKLYRELRRDAEPIEPVTGLGRDAFYSPLFQSVTVLRGGKLLEVSYEAELPDYTDDTSPPVVQANVDLAALALKRLG